MGTTLGYGMNPIASASNNNSSLANQVVVVVGDGGYSEEAARNNTSLNIDNKTVLDGQMFDLRKVDSIKKIMLMQEDVFRQQVYELHRQFERQTYLMNVMKKEAAITSRGNNSSELTIRPQPLQEMRQNFSSPLSRVDPGERGGRYSWDMRLTRPKGIKQLGRFAEEPESTIMRNDIGSENVNICTSMRNDIGSDDQIRSSYGLENLNNPTSMRNDIGPDEQIRSSYGLENVNNPTSMRNDIGSDQMRRSSYGLENVNNRTSMSNDIGSDQVHRSYGMENVNKWTNMCKGTNDKGSDQIGRSSYGIENVNKSMCRNDIGSDDQIRRSSCGLENVNVNNSTSMHNDIESDDQTRRSYEPEKVNNYDMSSDEADEEVDVELSLSIGCNNRSQKRLKPNGPSVPPQPPCSMDHIGSSVTNSNGAGPSSSAQTKRDSREHTLGDESSFDLGSFSSGRMTKNVAKSWFLS